MQFRTVFRSLIASGAALAVSGVLSPFLGCSSTGGDSTTGKRAPLEATKDAPRFFVVGGRLFAQCWAWADVIEADGTGHSFPRTAYQVH